MNKLVKALAATTAAFILAQAPVLAQAKPLNLRLGHIFATDSPMNQGAQLFADLIKERTDGEIKVNVFPNGQLGGDEALARDLSRGSLDLAFVNQGSLAGVDPLMDFLYLPYIATNFEETDAIFYNPNGIIQKTMVETMEKHGMVPIGFFELEFRALTNSKHEVNSPEDMKDLKIRVPGSAVIKGFVNETGAQTVTIPYPDLFTSLQQRTVDGQENGVGMSYDSRFIEAQEHVTLTNHVYAMGAITVSKRLWEKLSDEQKEIFRATAKEAGAHEIKLSRERNAKYIQSIEDSGIKVTRLTPENLQKFSAIADQVWTKFEPVYGKERINALREEVKNVRK